MTTSQGVVLGAIIGVIATAFGVLVVGALKRRLIDEPREERKLERDREVSREFAAHMDARRRLQRLMAAIYDSTLSTQEQSGTTSTAPRALAEISEGLCDRLANQLVRSLVGKLVDGLATKSRW